MGGFPRGGGGASVTWADDLAGSTDAAQLVAALQGHAVGTTAAGVTVGGHGPVGANAQPATPGIFQAANALTLPLTIVAATNDTFGLDPNGATLITYTIAPGTYNDVTEVAAALAAATGDNASTFGADWTVIEGPITDTLRSTSVAVGAGTVGYYLRAGATDALVDLGYVADQPIVPPGAAAATVTAALPAATSYVLGTITDLESFGASFSQPSSVMVVPDFAVVYQVQHAGEAYPRLVIVSDGSYYIGDGTFNPVHFPAQGLVPGGGGVTLAARSGNILRLAGGAGDATLESEQRFRTEATAGTMLSASGQPLSFFGATVVTQPGAVPDAAGGVVIDAEARTALNALLAATRALGAIAT